MTALLWAEVAHKNLVRLPGMIMCKPKWTQSGHFPACKTAFNSGLYSKSSDAGDTRSLIDSIFVYGLLANCGLGPFAFARVPVGPLPVYGIGPMGL
jgi:hypothetical protein